LRCIGRQTGGGISTMRPGEDGRKRPPILPVSAALFVPYRLAARRYGRYRRLPTRAGFGAWLRWRRRSEQQACKRGSPTARGEARDEPWLAQDHAGGRSAWKAPRHIGPAKTNSDLHELCPVPSDLATW